ncbi:TonB-system energizer ExbB [Hydrogenovibrio thermophilus]|uniref:TonB-system energizer ExbB n=1 Tax=Hydrogenovibrio thermophilus TaxID=265883 RepID=A0A410H5K3_9GAMM|nr:TonB-system energizer ExbB [Hydrogenovibrio thermophilus]QAB16212.1 TonB-system energizer ExbB [Hydrogenovibrio thermophilus]
MDILKLYLDITVFSLLGLMAFIATWFTLERLLAYRKVDVTTYNHIDLLTVDLTRNLTMISTVGANAPYVGLLGTVLGILVTFYELGMSGTMNTGDIMVGLALALKATAGGIALAIPSIIAYNLLMRRVEVCQAEYRAYEALNQAGAARG